MPRVTVVAIIEKDGKILFTKRNVEPFKGMWAPPGGHVEENERADDAVVRETKEETNLDIKPEFLFYQDEIFPEIGWHRLALIFHAKGEGEVTINEESTEFKWFTPKEAMQMKLAFGHERVIKRWIESQA